MLLPQIPDTVNNPFEASKGKKICMVGCHEYGGHLIPRLIANGLEFDHFVSINQSQAVKENVSGYYDFSKMAFEHGVPLYHAEKYNLTAAADIEFFRQQSFDLIIQGGWQRLIPIKILETLNVGAIGVHGSPDFLPKGRGRSPKNWSIINGKKRFILHLFFMKKGADDGDVFDFETFDINEFDDVQTLYYKNVLAQEIMMQRSFAELVGGSIKTYSQAGVSEEFVKRSPKDGKIDFENMDVYQIHDQIRALTKPYPGAFAELDGLGKTYLWKAQVFDTRLEFPDRRYGEVIGDFDGNLVINCRGGLLLLKDYEIGK